MRHPGQAPPTPYDRMESAPPDDLHHVEVWKDSSADENFDNYLIDGNTQMASNGMYNNNRQTIPDQRQTTTRGTIMMEGGKAHPNIKVGLEENEIEVRKKTFTGRKRKWPGALILLLIFAGAIFGIAHFASKLYNSTQKQQDKSEKLLNRKPKAITPIKSKFLGFGTNYESHYI